MNQKLKNCIIKIPNDISILYSENKKIITLIGPLESKSLKLKVKINLIESKKIIEVSEIPFSTISNKKIKAIQGTTVALIKQLIIETSTLLYQKLKLVGIGYKALNVENVENLLQLRLGFSHPIFFKIPKNFKIYNLKSTKLFIYTNSFNSITSIAAQIRALKIPEPYKGKGILYENEKIVIKEGKKS